MKIRCGRATVIGINPRRTTVLKKHPASLRSLTAKLAFPQAARSSLSDPHRLHGEQTAEPEALYGLIAQIAHEREGAATRSSTAQGP